MFRLFGSFRREFHVVHWILCIVATIGLIVASAISIGTVEKARSYNVNFEAIKKTVDDDGTQHLLLRGLSLRKGTYNLSIGYVSDAPAVLDISLDNDIYLSEELPATPDGSGLKNHDFEIGTGTDRGRIDFTYPAGSTLNLAYITISSDKPLYEDGIIWGIMILLLIPCFWAGMYFFCRSTHKASLVVAIVLVIIQYLPFALGAGFRLGIDTRAHMMRIEGIYYGLLDGQFPVVVCPEWKPMAVLSNK